MVVGWKPVPDIVPCVAAPRRSTQVADLLDPTVAVPPQRSDDASGQLAIRGQSLVGELGVGGDPCVLPAGDAEGVQVLLRGQDRLTPGIRGRRRDDVLVDPVRRALVQGAGGFAGRRVALDPTVGRVGGVPVDAGALQGHRVGPGAVNVPVEQEDRPIRHNGVEELLGGRPAREVLHRPAARRRSTPRPGGRRRSRRRRRRRPGAGEPVQVDGQAVAAGLRRVHVGVLEAREHEPAGQMADGSARSETAARARRRWRRSRRSGHPGRRSRRPPGRRCRTARPRSGPAGSVRSWPHAHPIMCHREPSSKR